MYGNSLNNFALLRKITCQYAEAERLYKGALRIFNKNAMTTAQVLTLNNVAVIKLKIGDWDSAEYYLGKALAARGEEKSMNITSRRDFLGKEEIKLSLSTHDFSHDVTFGGYC